LARGWGVAWFGGCHWFSVVLRALVITQPLHSRSFSALFFGHVGVA